MTVPELSAACGQIAEKVLDDNIQTITDHIMDSVDPEDDRDVIYGKMISNAIRLSVQISVGATVSVLLEMGIIDPDKYSVMPQAPRLTLLKFDE